MTAAVLPLPTIPKISLFRLQQASGAITYKFDDLHLDIEGGFGAGAFEGQAEVHYWTEDGYTEWFVDAITLRCSKWNGKTYDVRMIKLDRGHWLFTAIWAELTEGSHKDSVDAAVERDL